MNWIILAFLLFKNLSCFNLLDVNWNKQIIVLHLLCNFDICFSLQHSVITKLCSCQGSIADSHNSGFLRVSMSMISQSKTLCQHFFQKIFIFFNFFLRKIFFTATHRRVFAVLTKIAYENRWFYGTYEIKIF